MFQGVMETFAGLGMSIGPAFGGFIYEVWKYFETYWFWNNTKRRENKCSL